MANTVMAYEALGTPRDDENFKTARAAVDKLLVFHGDKAFCQPCLSPIWDTCLALHAMLEAGEAVDGPSVQGAVDWLLDREITGTYGDWVARRPSLKPSGWAFQYWNDHYPDVDDTAVVVMALDRTREPRCRPAIERATQWIIGMQSSNGGWGSFDPENEYSYLNHIPFADHGAPACGWRRAGRERIAGRAAGYSGVPAPSGRLGHGRPCAAKHRTCESGLTIAKSGRSTPGAGNSACRPG